MLNKISVGAFIGLAGAMALGIIPPKHRTDHEEDWITPQDRARAKEVVDTCDDDLPPGAVVIKCGTITIATNKKRGR